MRVKQGGHIEICGGGVIDFKSCTYEVLSDFDFETEKNRSVATGMGLADSLIMHGLITWTTNLGMLIYPYYIVSMDRDFSTGSAIVVEDKGISGD